MRLRARSEKELKEAARDDAHVVKIKTAYVFSTRVKGICWFESLNARIYDTVTVCLQPFFPSSPRMPPLLGRPGRVTWLQDGFGCLAFFSD